MTVCTCRSKLTENGKPQRIDNKSVLKNLKIEQGPRYRCHYYRLHNLDIYKLKTMFKILARKMHVHNTREACLTM